MSNAGCWHAFSYSTSDPVLQHHQLQKVRSSQQLAWRDMQRWPRRRPKREDGSLKHKPFEFIYLEFSFPGCRHSNQVSTKPALQSFHGRQ
jgi:hypothetical protein